MSVRGLFGIPPRKSPFRSSVSGGDAYFGAMQYWRPCRSSKAAASAERATRHTPRENNSGQDRKIGLCILSSRQGPVAIEEYLIVGAMSEHRRGFRRIGVECVVV